MLLHLIPIVKGQLKRRGTTLHLVRNPVLPPKCSGILISVGCLGINSGWISTTVIYFLKLGRKHLLHDLTNNKCITSPDNYKKLNLKLKQCEVKFKGNWNPLIHKYFLVYTVGFKKASRRNHERLEKEIYYIGREGKMEENEDVNVGRLNLWKVSVNKPWGFWDEDMYSKTKNHHLKSN